MKDLEKIKSEDLAAQVQDANPGNFAIEQEVAQLVGATVPQPTEPSADDARELGAQLLVFLRRALLPIRTALRTAVAAIYAHLDSRCTAYTPAAYDPFRLPAGPYDPMRPFVPRTLPNLLTALTAFAPRKISNLGNGISDGMSLARILGDSTASVTAIEDDEDGWTLDRGLFANFTGLTKLSLNCKKITRTLDGTGLSSCTTLVLDKLEEIQSNYGYDVTGIRNFSEITELQLPVLKKLSHNKYYTNKISYLSKCKKIVMPEFEEYRGENGDVGIRYCSQLEEIWAPKSKFLHSYINVGFISNCPALKRIVLDGIGMNAYGSSIFNQSYNSGVAMPDLIDIEFGHSGTLIAYNINIDQWNPTNVLADANKTATFLQNFREHIALRLTDNGSGKTLTLSQAVRDAIHSAEATYGIEAIIVTQKGWTLSPAPGASSQ